MTRSSTKELFTPFKDPEQEFRSSMKHFKTLSLDESRSPDFDLFFDQEEYSEEEVVKTMAETMEQYMSKTRADYGSGISRPKIEDKDNFELKGQFLKELRDNTFSSSNHEDANEHIKKVLEIVDLFHIPNITIDQVMLRAFLMSLTGAASHWLRNKPSGSITTWEDLKTKFLSKYCPPAHTAKKMEEINNFQQEPDENLYQAWERFKELLMKCPQHYLTESTRTRSTETFDGLASIQAQLNNLGREIKKVNEKVYAAQVGCEQCKGPHYTKDCPLKEEGKTLKEAYYTQFGAPFQGGGYRATAPGFYQRNNANPSHEENSNLIKDIRSSTDVAIRNQGASIKTLEIQIGQMSKEKDPRSFTLPCFINNVCFNNALADLGASVSVMPFLTYLNLGLGELAHTKLTVELADRTVKYPKGIAENMLVGIGKFVFLIDFIILDMPKDIKVLLILERPFLSTAHAKIDAFKRKITLRVGEEKIIFKSIFKSLEDMDAYRDEGMGDVIFGKPFLREVRINAKWFEGMITIHNGNDEVIYQMVRSHLRFKHHTNKQCNKIPPLLKASEEDKMNGISHSYQNLKGFYKGVLNLGPEYVQDVTMEEWLTHGHISVHE
ncbi:homeodomain-like protein [Tanacetum coccineum]